MDSLPTASSTAVGSREQMPAVIFHPSYATNLSTTNRGQAVTAVLGS